MRCFASDTNDFKPDVFACIENEWSELCTHPCRRVPQLSHGSFAGKCSASDATKDTVCSGSCDKGWTQGQPAPAAKCTSAGWVVEGSCKVRKVLCAAAGLKH